MISFLFFYSCLCEIYMFDKNVTKRTIVFDVTGEQICQGFFKPLNSNEGFFDVKIRSEDGGLFFEALNLKNHTPFAFNVSDNKDLYCEILFNPDKNNHFKKSELELLFETKFDTFNKSVAKQVRVEPATYTLTKLNNLLHEANIKTEELAYSLEHVGIENKKMFVFSIILSLATLISYIGVQIYLLQNMRKFFKNKKLI